MATNSLTGNGGVITVDSNAVAEVRSYSLEITQDTIENTVMGDSSRQYVGGLSQFSGTADVYWIDAHFSTADLDGLIQGAVGAAPVGIVVYEDGNPGSNWNGDILITGYSISASMDGMVEASVSFQGSGPLTHTP